MSEEINLKEKDLKKEDIKMLDDEAVDLLKIDVYQSNLGLRYIFDGFKEKKREYTGQWLVGPYIFTLLLISGLFIITYLDGTWILESGKGLIQDIEKIMVVYLALFLMLLFLKVFYNKLNVAFYDLCKNDIIDESKHSFETFKSLTHESERLISGADRGYKYEHIFDGDDKRVGIGFKGIKSLQIIAISILIFDTVKIVYFPDFLVDSWFNSSHLGILIYSRLEYLIVFAYLLPVVLWHFISTTFCIRKIITVLSSKDAFKLRPIAPDGVAGLKPIGELSLSMTYFITVPMIIIIPYLLLEFDTFHLEGFLLLVTYFALTITLFFLPLGVAHSIMHNAKDAELQKLSIEFNKAYEKYSKFEPESTEVTNDMKITVEYMERIGTLHHYVSKMAVWPFNLSIVLKFVATILLPLMVVLIEVMFNFR